MSEYFMLANTSWQKIVESFRLNPRDVVTVPLSNKKGVWFFVSSDGKDVFVENSKSHSNSSKISVRRKLERNKCDEMLAIYKRRNMGERVYQIAMEITRNQVYWYGIFAELGL